MFYYMHFYQRIATQCMSMNKWILMVLMQHMASYHYYGLHDSIMQHHHMIYQLIYVHTHVCVHVCVCFVETTGIQLLKSPVAYCTLIATDNFSHIHTHDLVCTYMTGCQHKSCDKKTIQDCTTNMYICIN